MSLTELGSLGLNSTVDDLTSAAGLYKLSSERAKTEAKMTGLVRWAR